MFFKHSRIHHIRLPVIRFFTVGTALVTLAGRAITAPGNLVANGDFSANAPLYQTAPGYSGRTNPVSPTGWRLPATATHKFAVAVGVNGSDTGVGTPFGPSSSAIVKDFAFMQGGANFISQTVATVAGRTYTLTYEAAARAGYPGTAAVLLKNTVDGKVFMSQAPAISDKVFRHFSLTFTALSALIQIKFENTTVGGNSSLDVSDICLNAFGK
ncbi:MAG: DUF642 domain-containing protein [Planctomycetia bacterium]|nr:DUF642 domain-containing protein [Planctomycetia bacterium]